jgi:hypothetical protein
LYLISLIAPTPPRLLGSSNSSTIEQKWKQRMTARNAIRQLENAVSTACNGRGQPHPPSPARELCPGPDSNNCHLCCLFGPATDRCRGGSEEYRRCCRRRRILLLAAHASPPDAVTHTLLQVSLPPPPSPPLSPPRTRLLLLPPLWLLLPPSTPGDSSTITATALAVTTTVVPFTAAASSLPVAVASATAVSGALDFDTGM